jgi:hypothetical protein
MYHKHDIAAKAPQRQELADCTAAFLANGGRINRIERPAERAPEPSDTPYGYAAIDQLNKDSAMRHLRGQRRRITTLRGAGLSDRAIRERLGLTAKQFKNVLG